MKSSISNIVQCAVLFVMLLAGCGGGGGGGGGSGKDIPLPATTLSATFGVKQVILNWTAVNRATYYRVLKNIPDDFPNFVQIGGDITATTYTDTLSVHFTDGLTTQYRVQSCNAWGCTSSNTVGPLDATPAIGYVKHSVAGGNLFGFAVALSGDGNTLAVGMPTEKSAASGINNTNPGPGDSNAPLSGAVNVYVRNTTNGAWSLQAYIKTSYTDSSNTDTFGWSVALSSDGNTLVAGAPGESSAATGTNNAVPGPADNSMPNSGAAYLFTRVNGAWSQQVYVKASNTGTNDSFGSSVALSSNGATFAVGAPGEGSAATGVNNAAPGQGDNSASSSGAVYVFVYAGGSCYQQAYVKASNAGTNDFFGNALSLSGDGNTLAVGAPYEAGAGSGIDNTAPGQADNNASQSGAVYVFARTSDNWAQQSYVKASNPDAGDFFGQSVSLSSDGNALIVGAPYETGNGVGPYSTPTNAMFFAGAAYLFNRANSSWSQSAYIKASNTGQNDYFGYAVSMAADGLTFAVGAPWESGNSKGIDNSAAGQANNGATSSGAVYVFQYNPYALSMPWFQTTYVKARNTGALDLFGSALSLSGNATTLAVGAYYEDSAATGINNVTPGPGDNSTSGSGAVYLY